MKKDTRLILALDVTAREQALSLAEKLCGYFDAIKIGYPLILSASLEILFLPAPRAPQSTEPISMW